MSWIDRANELLGKLPTTQFRILVSCAAILATTGRYIASREHVLPNGQVTSIWTPSYEWLGFLLLLAGVDSLHYLAKRVTDTDYAAVKTGATK